MTNTKHAALPPGLAGAIAQRAGIGAAGGAVAGAAGGALNAGEGNRLQGAFQGGLVGGAAGGTLGAGSGVLRAAPQLGRAHLRDMAAAGHALAPKAEGHLMHGAQGLRSFGGAMVSKPALAAGAVGTAGLGALAAPGTEKQANAEAHAAAELERMLISRGITGGAVGGLSGGIGGVLGADDGHVADEGLRGAARGALAGTAMGLTSGALQHYGKPFTSHAAHAVDQGMLTDLRHVASGAAHETGRHLATPEALAGLGLLSGAAGKINATNKADSRSAEPAEAIKTAYSALESAILHAADGAALGGVTGAVAGGEGHRMEGAGRGALAGAAMGGGLHALHRATLKARGLTFGAIDASADRAVERARAEAIEGLKDLNNTRAGEFTLDDFIHAQGRGPVAQEKAFNRNVDTRNTLHKALNDAPDVGSNLRRSLEEKSQLQHGLYTGGHYALPALAGGVAGYTTPGESKQANAANNAQRRSAAASKTASAVPAAEISEAARAAYTAGRNQVPSELMTALAHGTMNTGTGALGGAAVGGITGAAGSDSGHRWEGAGKGAVRGAAMGAGLGLGTTGLHYAGGNYNAPAIYDAMAHLGTGGALGAPLARSPVQSALGFAGNVGSSVPGALGMTVADAAAGYSGRKLNPAAESPETAPLNKAAAYTAGQRRVLAALGLHKTATLDPLTAPGKAAP